MELARIVVFVLSLYLVLKLIDISRRELWHYLFINRTETYFFWAEWIIGVFAPMILLATPRIRQHQLALFWSVLMVILGFVMSRLNIAITGMESYSQAGYFPSWMEIIITIFIVALGFAVFRFVVKNFAVFEKSHAVSYSQRPIRIQVQEKPLTETNL
jgi:Ni/Fe-hydrogenase subunit HybB-like protein